MDDIKSKLRFTNHVSSLLKWKFPQVQPEEVTDVKYL